MSKLGLASLLISRVLQLVKHPPGSPRGAPAVPDEVGCGTQLRGTAARRWRSALSSSIAISLKVLRFRTSSRSSRTLRASAAASLLSSLSSSKAATASRLGLLRGRRGPWSKTAVVRVIFRRAVRFLTGWVLIFPTGQGLIIHKETTGVHCEHVVVYQSDNRSSEDVYR